MVKKGTKQQKTAPDDDARSVSSAVTSASVKTPIKTGPKVPKAVADLKEQFRREGEQFTPEAIKLLPADTRKKVFSAIRYEISSKDGAEAAKEFSEKSEDEKRNMLVRFLIDPSCGTRKVSNTNAHDTFDGTVDNEQWCTIAELSAPHRCNGMEAARLYAEDASEREHDRPAYRKAGIKQYLFVASQTVRSDGNRDSVETRAEAEVPGRRALQIEVGEPIPPTTNTHAR